MITPGPLIIIWIIKTFIVQKIIAYLHPVTYITVTYDVLMFLFFCLSSVNLKDISLTSCFSFYIKSSYHTKKRFFVSVNVDINQL